nr:potassium voltage-gated channel subfamily C member 1-like [Anolis sagrei ordinatus]
MKPAQEKVTLNIGGIRYQTYLSTLQAFPGTKLGQLTEPQAFSSLDYDPNRKEFFFDRNADLFDEVLNYYRTKHFHCTREVCESVLEEEMAFWGIQGAAFAPCCEQALKNTDEPIVLDEDEEDMQGFLEQAEGNRNSCRARWQPKIWALLEKPRSSFSAKCLAAICLLFNISICILALLIASDIGMIYHYEETKKLPHPNDSPKQIFRPYFYLELSCVLWFTLEFTIRATFCPNKKKFLMNPLNIADFLSLFPAYIEIISRVTSSRSMYWSSFLRILYFPKLLKMLKLLETPMMFKVLSYTSRSLLREALILLMVFVLEIIFFGILVFYAEFLQASPENFFDNLFSSFWWAAITLTTVGYGDMYPYSTGSRIIGTCTAVSGILTIAVPIALFYIKFKDCYDAAVVKEKVKRMKKTPPALRSSRKVPAIGREEATIPQRSHIHHSGN